MLDPPLSPGGHRRGGYGVNRLMHYFYMGIFVKTLRVKVEVTATFELRRERKLKW